MKRTLVAFVAVAAGCSAPVPRVASAPPAVATVPALPPADEQPAPAPAPSPEPPPATMPPAGTDAECDPTLMSCREADPPAEMKIRASHLLIAWVGTKRVPSHVTRNRTEARRLVEEIEARAHAGEAFADLAQKYSDEKGSGRRGGDLGRFDRRMMVRAFSDVAFALKVGQLSGVVETEFGFHLILRTE